jgi:hypothetical protein
MSMLATFIQVEPRVLERLREAPGVAERLFAPPVVGFDAEKMRALILARGPQLMAGAIDLHPQLREQLEQSLGTTQEALRGGAGGEAIVRLMQERLGGPPGGGAVQGRRELLSLDKAWHGVHYLLTGAVEPTETPIGQAVLGGVEVGEDFSGYGPARVFDQEQTATIGHALDDPALEDNARSRFDPRRMTELGIYPFGWDAESLEWLLSPLRDLRRFYAGAAAGKRAIVTCLE